MSENYIQVIITLSAPQLDDEKLDDEKLQQALQNLRLELEEVDGVSKADLISAEEAPSNSKSIGGFLLGKLKAVVSPQKLKALVSFLGNHIFGQSIEIKAEGNGKKLEVKIRCPEDLEAIMPKIDEFINK